MTTQQNKTNLTPWVAGGVALAAALGFVKVMADRQERQCAAAVEKVRGLVGQAAWAEAQAELGIAADVCRTVRQEERTALTTTINQALGAPTAGGAEPPAIVRICGAAAGQPKYVVKTSERLDIMVAGKTIPRLSVRVSVPPALSREELQANVCHALISAYGSDASLGAVGVFAYGSPETEGAYSAAQGTFAPDGDWAKADPGVPRSEWRMTIEFASGYFEAKAPALAVGAAVVLRREGGGTIAMSRDPKNSTDDLIVARVPSQTGARVMNVKEFPIADGKTLVRYDVETVAPKRRGWVWAADVRSE